MSTARFIQRASVLTFASIFVVSGCATTGGTTTSGIGGCGAETYLLAGGVGAILGALAGGEKGAAYGAAGGAALAAAYCFGVKSETKQAKTATQVEQEYKRANQGGLPDDPQVVAYKVQMNPLNGRVAKGNTLEINSQADVLNGRLKKADKVEEELVLSLGGEKVQNVVKPMPSTAGGFESVHKITIPQQFQEGNYQVASRLRINGQPVANTARKQTLQIVRVDGEMRFALLESSPQQKVF